MEDQMSVLLYIDNQHINSSKCYVPLFGIVPSYFFHDTLVYPSLLFKTGPFSPFRDLTVTSIVVSSLNHSTPTRGFPMIPVFLTDSHRSLESHNLRTVKRNIASHQSIRLRPD